MKKHYPAIVLTLLLLLTSVIPVFAAGTVLGDVDGDGKISASDARIALRTSVGLDSLSDSKFKAADADKDNKITASDARLILRASVGLEDLDDSTAEERGYYKAGEIWKVEGNWEFTITGVSTHSLCNDYANKTEDYSGKQVVTIDFAYKNTGYNDEGYSLYMDIYDVCDESGTAGELYPCAHTKSPASLIEGTNCTGSAAFVVSSKCKTITVDITDYDENGDKHSAVYKVDIGTKKQAPKFQLEISDAELNSYYKVGDVWKVKGNWEVTITGIKTHNLCNEFSNDRYNYKNQQVVVISYTYKNIGNSDDDLYISLNDVYDEQGTAADLYACTHTDYGDYCSVGESSSASEAFVLTNNSDFVILRLDESDSNSDYNTAVFKLDIK